MEEKMQGAGQRAGQGEARPEDAPLFEPTMELMETNESLLDAPIDAAAKSRESWPNWVTYFRQWMARGQTLIETSVETPPNTDQAPAEVKGRPAFLVTVQGLSFVALSRYVVAKERCEDTVEEAVGSVLGLLPMEVSSMGGKTRTQFAVIAPAGCTRKQVESQLGKACSLLCHRVGERLKKLDGLSKATLKTGLSVSHVSGATYSTVVRFQGHWLKDDSPYAIIGYKIRFPSGGRTDIKPITPESFRILHPSGMVFEAFLEDFGQKLRWTNGSVWHRTTNVLAEEVAQAEVVEDKEVKHVSSSSKTRKASPHGSMRRSTSTPPPFEVSKWAKVRGALRKSSQRKS